MRTHPVVRSLLLWIALAIVHTPAARCQRGRSASVFPWHEDRHIDRRNTWRPVAGQSGSDTWSRPVIGRPRVAPTRRPVAPDVQWPRDRTSAGHAAESSSERAATRLLLGESFYHRLARGTTLPPHSSTPATPATTTSPAATMSSHETAGYTGSDLQPEQRSGRADSDLATAAKKISSAGPAASASNGLTSLLAALLSGSGSTGGGASALATLLKEGNQKPTTTTTTTSTTTTTTTTTVGTVNGDKPTRRPSSFLSSLLTILTRPRPNRPVSSSGAGAAEPDTEKTTVAPTTNTTTTTTTTTSTTATTPKPDKEVQLFDNGFQLFSHLYGGGNAHPTTTSEPTSSTEIPAGNPPDHPKPGTKWKKKQTISQNLPQALAQTSNGPPSVPPHAYQPHPHVYRQPPPGYPYRYQQLYRPGPPPHLQRRPSALTASEKFDSSRPLPQYPLPYYYNTAVSTTAVPVTAPPPPRINMNQAFGSVVQLIRRDGPDLMSSIQRAGSLMRDGDYLAVLQTVMPVLSRTTPVLMNVLEAVSPLLQRFGWAADGGGGSSVVQGLWDAGVSGRRPQKALLAADKNDVGINVPYYTGRVIGAGLKLATYLVRFGTSVIHDRSLTQWLATATTTTAGAGGGAEEWRELEQWLLADFGEELEWLRREVGPDNWQLVAEWLQAQQLVRR